MLCSTGGVIQLGKVQPDEVEVNVALPKDLAKRVIKYQHRQELSNKKDAYRDLLEIGLEHAKQEAPKG
jgi:hypothetical protein